MSGTDSISDCCPGIPSRLAFVLKLVSDNQGQVYQSGGAALLQPGRIGEQYTETSSSHNLMSSLEELREGQRNPERGLKAAIGGMERGPSSKETFLASGGRALVILSSYQIYKIKLDSSGGKTGWEE